MYLIFMDNLVSKAVLENVLGNYIYDQTTHDKKEELLHIIIQLQIEILSKLDTIMKEKEDEVQKKTSRD